jgi:hypothetical protein
MITLNTQTFAALQSGDWVVKDITEKEAVYQFLLTDSLTEWDTFSMSRDPLATPVYSSHKGFRLHRHLNKEGFYRFDFVDMDKTYNLTEAIASSESELFNKAMQIIEETKQ